MCTAGFAYIASGQCGTASAGTAAVSSAGMSLFMVAAAVAFLMMVVTVCSGRYQFSFQISLYCLIYIALSSCTQFYSGLFKSCLSTSADASADQYIYILFS